MKNIYKPTLTDKEGYKVKIKFLTRKVFINSVYGKLKEDYFWLSDEFNRREEIRKKRELRIEKLNKLNN
jgi:hypothetical protein